MPQEYIHPEVEATIQRLSPEVKGQAPEAQQDIVKSALRERITRVQNFPASGIAPATSNAPVSTRPSVLPAYAGQSSAGQQLIVEQLVDLALHQGLEKAVTAATKQDAIILDMFHDALTGKLYQLMHERKLI